MVGVADEDGILEADEIYAYVARQGERKLYLEGDICISNGLQSVLGSRPSSSLKPDFVCPEWQSTSRNVDNQYSDSNKGLGQLFRSVPIQRDWEGGYRVRAPSRDSIDLGRPLTDALKSTRIDGIPFGVLGEPDRELIAYFRQFILPDFCDNLLRRARGNTLARTSQYHLSEEETFVGTILAASKDKKGKQDLIIQLQEQINDLFSELRQEIARDEEGDLGEQAKRAWAAWHSALEFNQEIYGVKRFGWVALGLLLSNLAELNSEK